MSAAGTLGSVAAEMDILELGRLGLSSGEGRRLELSVGFDPLEFGGERYEVAGTPVTASLDVSRTTAEGHALRLRYRVRLSGPCTRCLEDARAEASIDAREVEQPGAAEELDSPYVRDDRLDLRAWARDALVLALPAQIVCREQCLGLCAVCGENLNEAGPDHHHDRAPDPRWAKLDELRLG